VNKFIKSFGYAQKGILTVLKEEQNFRIEIFIGLLVILSSFVLGFSYIEKIILLIAVILVLSSEMINTAIEDLCDKIEPKDDPVIGKIKDIMAGFVLVCSLGASIVGLIIFAHNI